MYDLSSRTVRRQPGERGGAFVLFTLLLSMVMLPFMGLSIDMGMAYLGKSRLMGAVDGAALAGARALNSTDANATAVASQYFYGNFPTNYLKTLSITPSISIDNSQPHVRTVTVTGQGSIQTSFLAFLGKPTLSIAASAKSSRRDVNMMLVLDRSGSIAASGSCPSLKSSALNFVAAFSEGHDSLGLITFSTAVSLDVPSNTTFVSNMTTVINNLVCSGGTGSAIAIDTAWSEISRVQAANPGMLNILVFFTDGAPTEYAADFYPKTGSTCNSGPNGFHGLDVRSGANVDYRNTVPVRGILYADPSVPISLGIADYLDHGSDPYIYATESNDDGVRQSSTPNCHWTWLNYYGTWYFLGSTQDSQFQFPYIPEQDYRGNYADWLTPPVGYTRYKQAQRDSNGLIPLTIQNSAVAAINAADTAAWKIRYNASTIFTIGLGSDVDATWLTRIANDPSSTYFDTSYNTVDGSLMPSGRYAFASNASQLSTAFTYIRSQVLRLSR